MYHTKHYVKIVVIFWIFVGLQPQLIQQPITATTLETILINEIMCRPVENENTNEWIELYNPTSEPFDVAGWMIADEKETDTIEADTINGDGITIIPSEGYALLTDKGTTIYTTMNMSVEAVRLSVDDSTLCGYGLNNNQEKIVLLDAEGNILDAIEYGVDYEEVPGSPFAVVAKGATLARYPGVDIDDTAHDFCETTTPTPGSVNLLPRQDELPEEEPPSEEQYPEENTGSVSSSLLIIELFYDTYPNINAEYVRVCNPTNTTIEVSGWYLSNKPWKEPDDRPKIMFPDQTFMRPRTSWILAKNASAFFWETAIIPDFEYAVDAHPIVPQLETFRTVVFSNIGGSVGVFTASHNLVDLMSYGDLDEEVSGWEGSSIPSSGQGIVLKRNSINGTPLDTNTVSDWLHPRIYRIGQSDFPLQTIHFTGEITVFVSPDNSYTAIIQELQNAQHSIDINMYEFTNFFLYQELRKVLQRNVTVRLFMEGSPIGGINNRELAILGRLASEGAQVRFLISDNENSVYARYPFNHAKYLLIDNDTVIVGSGNWGTTGIPKDPTFGNREWGIVLRNKEVAAIFSQMFQDDWNPDHMDSRPLEAMNETIFPVVVLDDDVPFGAYIPRFNATTLNETCVVTPVFSPDTSEETLLAAIDAATCTIYIQQLYIYRDWGDMVSPLVQHLVNKSVEGIEVRIILDENKVYEATSTILKVTKEYLEAYGIEVKCISSDWSPFSVIHNKGMIIDNTTVLISSINWNEQSVRKNREAGVLVQNQKIASYYTAVFLADWNLTPQMNADVSVWAEYKYLVLIAVVVCITLVLIARDWRKRKWT